MNTIHMNSKTLGLLFTANHPISVPLCEPEFQSHFRPHTHHNTIYSTNYIINNPNSPWTVTDYPNGFQKLPHFGSKIWNRIKRSFKASSQPKHYKILKQSVTSSRIKPLPHRVYRNSLKLVPTRSPHCVEPLSFLSRRIPTVGSPRNLERSHSLSL